MSPPLVINAAEVEKSAEIICNVINRAQHLNPDFSPNASATFNIPSTGTNYESQYIINRRSNKLKALGLSINTNVSTGPSTHLLQQGEPMNPYQQIQAADHTQHIQQTQQTQQTQQNESSPTDFTHVENPFGMSPSNILGLKLGDTPTVDDKDNEIIFDSEMNKRI